MASVLAVLAIFGPMAAERAFCQHPELTKDDGRPRGPLAAWRAALARACAGRGQARIAMFGDSHVASDGLSGALREVLQRRCGDGGPGFVVPVAPTPFYAPRRVVLSATGPWRRLRVEPRDPAPGAYGLGGAAVEASSRRAVAVLRVPAIDRIELWTLAQPGGGALEVRVDGRLTVLPTSASTEAAAFALVPVAGPGAHSIELRPRGDGPVRIFGLTLDRSGPGVVLDALGLDGARADHQKLWRADVLGEHLRHRAADLVVLAYGTNEIVSGRPPARAFEADLRDVVARVQRLTPDASCLLIGPTDVPFAPEPRRRSVRDVMERVARAAGCAFFDTVAAEGGPDIHDRWAAASQPFVLGDLVHLTDAGYARLAAVLARVLAP